MSVGDTLVLVEMGELIQGTVDKRTVGNAQGSLIHLIWVEYGPFRCAQFFTEVQKMVNHWLINNGFSIGIGDAVATSSVLAEIENTITSAKTEVSNIINRARAGKLERTPGRTVNETFEGEVNGVLNKATDAYAAHSTQHNCAASAPQTRSLIPVPLCCCVPPVVQLR